LLARPAAPDFRALDALLTQYVADGRQPGISALLVRDGQVLYRKAFGLADVAADTPLTPEAIVRIASQTKALTSAGLMLLYDEGRFGLDEPVSKYLPAFRNPRVLAAFNARDSTYTSVPARAEITIRQLLTHTSGLSHPVIGSPEMGAIYAKAHIPSGIGTPGGLLATAVDRLATLPLAHEPGARFTYGLSVDVVGRLVEVLSGQPLDAYLKARLFEPLGMRDTYFYLPADRAGRLARLYTEDSQTKATVPMRPRDGLTPDYPLGQGTYFSGGAGLCSTLDDYAAFLQMLLDGGTCRGRRLLAASTVRLMTGNQIGELMVGDRKFGLGFGLTTPTSAARTGLSVGSFEWSGSLGTAYWADPEQKLVVLLYTQKYPNTTAADLTDKFKRAVYAAFK